MLYACDLVWWQRYHPDVKKAGFSGETWTQDFGAARLYGLQFIKTTKSPGLQRRPGMIGHGANSGYQAIGLAWQFGAARIVLVGYDMQHTAGRRHWFGNHPRGLTNAAGIEGWVKNFKPLAVDLKRLGVELINCSRQTALTFLQRAEISDVL